MFNPQLQAYIASSRTAGMNDTDIKASLLAHGWAEKDVNEALAGQAVPSPQGHLELSSGGIRFLNNILDSIGIYIFYFVLGMVIAVMANDSDPKSTTGPILIAVISIALPVLYYIFFESIWQRTPGKWITGTKVAMPDGSKPDFLHILGRSFARLIPFDAFSFLFIKRGWHDSLSNTIVVPKNYTAAEISQIDLKQKNGRLGWVWIIVGGFLFLAIVGILASVVLVSLNTARGKSRDALRLSNVRSTMTNLELYYNEHSAYPVSLEGIMIYDTPFEMPIAPTPADGNCSVTQNSYNYRSTTDGQDYTLTFCLGDVNSGFSAGPHSANKFGIN